MAGLLKDAPLIIKTARGFPFQGLGLALPLDAIHDSNQNRMLQQDLLAQHLGLRRHNELWVPIHGKGQPQE